MIVLLASYVPVECHESTVVPHAHMTLAGHYSAIRVTVPSESVTAPRVSVTDSTCNAAGPGGALALQCQSYDSWHRVKPYRRIPNDRVSDPGSFHDVSAE